MAELPKEEAFGTLGLSFLRRIGKGEICRSALLR